MPEGTCANRRVFFPLIFKSVQLAVACQVACVCNFWITPTKSTGHQR